MSDAKTPSQPVVLELAPLPRTQTGPFLLLGVDKTADGEQIEKNWAKRLIWARKKQIKVPLEDINWARDQLSDPGKRVQADAASLNVDTTDETLKQLASKYANSAAAQCEPVDQEKDLSNYYPPVDIPDAEALRNEIHIPDVPREFPVVEYMLREFVKEPLDPWDLHE